MSTLQEAVPVSPDIVAASDELTALMTTHAEALGLIPQFSGFHTWAQARALWNTGVGCVVYAAHEMVPGSGPVLYSLRDMTDLQHPDRARMRELSEIVIGWMELNKMVKVESE